VTITVAPTAAQQDRPGLVTLATGDVRVPVFEAAAGQGMRPRDADQPYPLPTGRADLRAAIAAHVSGTHAGSVGEDQVLLAPGARLALVGLLASVCGPRRNQVLFSAPYWPSYPPLIQLAHGVPALLSRRRPRELLVEVVERHRTPATAALVVNSPRNPDGAVLGEGEIGEVVDWAARHGVMVIFDQVYRGVPVGSQRPPSVLDRFTNLPDHCLVVDGLSKSHALAGLRIGWALAGGHLATQAKAVLSHLVGGVCAIGQDVALLAIEDSLRIQERLRPVLNTNRARAVDCLSALNGVECRLPQGGIFVFPDLTGWLARSASPSAQHDLTGWLRDRHGVAVVDGAAFGAPGHLRLSYAVARSDLDEGLHRLADAITGARSGSLP